MDNTDGENNTAEAVSNVPNEITKTTIHDYRSISKDEVPQENMTPEPIKYYFNVGLWEEGTSSQSDAAERLITRAGQLLELGPQSDLLEVGCGTGSCTLFLYNLYKCSTIGLAGNAHNLRTGQELAAQEHAEGKVRFVEEKTQNFPFENEVFTHIISLEEPQRMIPHSILFKEVSRVLLPGGVFVAGDVVLQRQPDSIWEKTILNTATAFWHGSLESFETTASYKEKLTAAGLYPVEVVEVPTQIEHYFKEQLKPEVRHVLGNGWSFSQKMKSIAISEAFKKGLLGYVLMKARKV